MRQFIPDNKGFTLVELLIAIFIFTIISVIALNSFMSAMKSKEKVVEVVDDLTKIQTAYVVIKRDVSQIVNRAILTQRGINSPAVISGVQHQSAKKVWGSNMLEFTRMGNKPLVSNNQKVSNLVRIAYYFDGNTLRRINFRELDQTKGELIDSKEIMKDISDFRIKFIDVFGSEVSSWFMESSSSNSSSSNLPYGIIVRFTAKSLGDIEWVFALPVLNNKY